MAEANENGPQDNLENANPDDKAGEYTVLRSGFGTFFTKIFDYDFITQYYFPLYSRNGVRFNRDKAIFIYCKLGILNYQYVNAKRERVNIDVLKSSNSGYQGLSNAQAVDRFLTQDIHTNCVIDRVPTTPQVEPFPTPETPESEFAKNIAKFYSDAAGSRTVFSDFARFRNLEFDDFPTIDDIENVQTANYTFLTDVVNWIYVAYSNPEIQKYGYVGSSAVIQWFLEKGIYNRVKINPYGSYINLDNVVSANSLSELRTYDQVVSWILQFGNTDPDAVIATPEFQTNLYKSLKPGSYLQNGKMTNIINNYVKNNLVSGDYIPTRPEAEQALAYPPKALINGAVAGAPAADAQAPGTADGLANAAPSDSAQGYARQFASEGGTKLHGSTQARLSSQQQQEAIINETEARASVTNQAARKELAVSAPRNLYGCQDCKKIRDSYATSKSVVTQAQKGACPTCVNQTDRNGTWGVRRGFITPLSLSDTVPDPILFKSHQKSVLLPPGVSGASLFNSSSNRAAGSNIFGGGSGSNNYQNYVSSKNRPHYNLTHNRSFTNNSNLIYFS
jgi:hypothetical protein